jgi:hypothetical protein
VHERERRLAADGPDVIVGDLPDFSSYTPYDGVAAFAVGREHSCDIGDRNLAWVSATEPAPGDRPEPLPLAARERALASTSRSARVASSSTGFTALNGAI